MFAGVYVSSSTEFDITGNLILDAQNNPDAIWIFQSATTLTTASGSHIILINGAQAGNVFWQVGTSATLGTNSDFSGTIMAYQSITLTTGATVDGRVLALNGAVTMDSNTITIPEPGCALLLGFGTAGLFAFRRRSVSRA